MKIGFISDTHRHAVNLAAAIEFVKKLGAEKIIHLGDDYRDTDEIGEEDVMRVPGVFSEEYQNHRIPNRRVENLAGWQVLLTHTISSHENDLPGDIKPEDLIKYRKVDIVLYGHTHMPEIRRKHSIIFANPGHLKDTDKKGCVPTFGFLEITEKEVCIEIYDLKELAVYKKASFTKEA